MRPLLRVLFVAVLVLVPASVFAQASIVGVVRDSSGAVLPGATVEASSPVLIEKVRAVTTDSTGQYKIIDLRPGTYAVTFSLTGFKTVKRDGIELTGSFAAAVNADLAVGSVAETITVTGEAPVVDVQNTKRGNVVTAEVVSALPAARSQYNLAVLVPGVTLTSFSGSNQQDVGGTRSMNITIFTVHGSRSFDQRLMVNGLTARNLLASAWASNYVPDMGTAAEVALDYSSGSAEAVGAGFQMNLIPKEGGNTFKASIFGVGTSGKLQSNNIDDDLKSRGLGTPNELNRNYDINPSIGGPVIKNKLWFFGSMRWQENSFYLANAYANKNGGDLTKWTYVPDLTQRGLDKLTINPSGSVRLTWQPNQKNKFGFSADPQNRHWIFGLVNTAPEVYPDWVFQHESFTTAYYQAPITNRLLIDVRYANHAEAFVDTYPGPDDPYRFAIPVRELSNNFLFRGKGYCCLPVTFGTQDAPFIQQAHASVSYVTGAHAFKVGFSNDFGTSTSAQFDNAQGLFYKFNNGVPVSIEEHAKPFTQTTHLSWDLGIYVQDKWTVNRATINAGLRFEYFQNGFPQQHLGPASFVPNRDITIPALDYASLKDIMPRLGVAYDLFGDGKTAFKANWGKYTIGADPTQGNPLANLSTVANRGWTPSLPSGHPNYYTPQCDLNNPAANGDCGALDNALFGSLTPSQAIDPDIYTGWNHRQYNEEFSASVQHQIVPRVSVDFGYFRRWYGNIQITKNRAVTTADYSTYSITSPNDPRLPSSGQVIGGLYEVNPAKASLVDNLVTFADNYGNQYEHWNGFDLTINARPRGGVLLQGGLSTGRTSTDNCDLRNKVPEITLQFGIIGVPQAYCHVDTNFLTQLKFLGTYLVPKVDVQFGVTLQSAPGPQINANQLILPFQTTPVLRSFSAAGVRLVNLVPPGTQYTDRANQLDVRLSKILRLGRTRASINFDLANVLNSNYVLGQNGSYGSAWLNPLNIMDGRLLKIGAQVDF